MRLSLRRNSRRLAPALGLAFLTAPYAVRTARADFAADEALFAPMRAEMSRSFGKLTQESFGPPYFMAYRLIDQRRCELTASYGAILQDSDDAYRNLYAEVRFGSHALDNTDLNFRGVQGAGATDPDVLRERLWALTDAGYKGAVAGFLEKKARLATELEPDKLDDFSSEASTSADEPSPDSALERERARELARRVSAVFRRHPRVYDSQVAAHLKWARRYLLTSEGARLATPANHVPHLLRVSAMTRAEDGMRLDNQVSWAFRDFSELPPRERLEAEAERLARELEELRQAPVQAPMAAPAVLDQELTGVLFHEALGHKLEGQRQRDPQQSQLFRDQVGKRIIPEFLSLLDDPTLASYGGQALSGHYDYDDEGVRSQRVVLVEKGILRNFLMSRWPVKGFSRSNGHGRSDAQSRPTGRMASLILRAESPLSRGELTRRLLKLIRRAGKPYGFLLVGAFGGENPTSRAQAQTLEVRPRLVYRVDAKTGGLTLVRGVSLVGTPLVILNRIVAAADDPVLSNAFYCGAESGYIPVSQIAPSTLISEVELQRLPEDRARPPILEPPWSAQEPAP